jgi:hypothetical protein
MSCREVAEIGLAVTKAVRKHLRTAVLARRLNGRFIGFA